MNIPLYIIPIIIMIIIIIFKLHLRFALCNLFTVPVFFTLLPLLIYVYELNNPSYGFGGSHLGSVIWGMLYALPMTIITLIIAIASYKPWTKNKSIYAIIIIIVISITWLSYYQYISYDPNSSQSNTRIERDIVSAKQIWAIINQELKINELSAKYDLKMYSLSMNLDRKQKGSIHMYVIDETSLQVFRCEVNTRTNDRIKIYKESGTSSLYLSYIINLDEWIIDSTDAVRIAQDFYKDRADFKYDQIVVNYINIGGSNSLFVSDTEIKVWQVSHGYNAGLENGGKSFYVYIDPFTGEILDNFLLIKGIRE